MKTDQLARLEKRAGVVERPVRAIRLAGPDARRFANNMFTNNVRDLGPGGANRHALTDDRGRVQGFLDLLCETDESFLAFVEGLTEAAFLERFEKYIVFDDVEMTPTTELSTHLVFGPSAAAAVASAGLSVPEPGHFVADDRGFVWWQALGPRREGGLGLAMRDSGPLEALDAEPWSVDDFELVRVLAGHVAHPDDTGPKALPHELGLREVVLSFDKGCYLGQESINRIDVMGQVKRQLRAVRLRGTVADDREVRHQGKVVGQLTSPVPLDDGATVGLAILKQAAEPGATVTVGGASGTVLALPVDREALEASSSE